MFYRTVGLKFASVSAQKAASSSPLSFGRIAKPLRGGGGNAAAITSTGPSPTASSANPLARLQNEDSGCVFGRSRLVTGDCSRSLALSLCPQNRYALFFLRGYLCACISR